MLEAGALGDYLAPCELLVSEGRSFPVAIEYLPRAVNFISELSRTADIEQTVTLGAHGPYRVHIVLVDA